MSKFDSSLLGLNFIAFKSKVGFEFRVRQWRSPPASLRSEEVGQCRDFFSLGCGFAQKKYLALSRAEENISF
jgi:hypothetical protein